MSFILNWVKVPRYRSCRRHNVCFDIDRQTDSVTGCQKSSIPLYPHITVPPAPVTKLECCKVWTASHQICQWRVPQENSDPLINSYYFNKKSLVLETSSFCMLMIKSWVFVLAPIFLWNVLYFCLSPSQSPVILELWSLQNVSYEGKCLVSTDIKFLVCQHFYMAQYFCKQWQVSM